MEFPSAVHETTPLLYGVDVRELPSLAMQAADSDRQEVVTSLSGVTYGIGSDTCIKGNTVQARAFTEQKALSETVLLLEEAMTNPRSPVNVARQAEDIYENASFIGAKELAEASRSIADYWKAYLRDDPDNVIFIVTGSAFAETTTEELEDDYQDDDPDYVSSNKSDRYVLDKILSEFNNEELTEFSDRFLFSAIELADHDPQAVKTVVIDDWIMSGQQMTDTLHDVFRGTTPPNIEINLVVSNKDRLVNGFTHPKLPTPIPIKSYFTCRSASDAYASEFGKAYITGAHSTGDYPFEGAVENIVDRLNSSNASEGEEVCMPPLTNIVRPYYSPRYEHRQIERLHLLRMVGSRSLTHA